MLANFEPFEGTVTTETTLSFARKSRNMVITNDDTTNSLSFKFNDSESFGTIAAGESLSLWFTAKKIIIDGTSVAYRIWVYS